MRCLYIFWTALQLNWTLNKYDEKKLDNIHLFLLEVFGFYVSQEGCTSYSFWLYCSALVCDKIIIECVCVRERKSLSVRTLQRKGQIVGCKMLLLVYECRCIYSLIRRKLNCIRWYGHVAPCLNYTNVNY